MLRSRLISAVVVVCTATTPSVGIGGAAVAAPPTCEKVNTSTGKCLVEVKLPAASPVRDPGPGAEAGGSGGGTGGGGGPTSCMEGGQPVPCSHGIFGTWSNALQCYLGRTEPQPPATDPVWGGRHGQGAVYACVQPDAGPTSIGSRTFVWLPGPPEEAAMSPEQAAQIVVAQMDLQAADIGIVPESGPDRMGAVGAPVYMWTEPGPTTFGPQVLTASAGGVTITATARVERIVWSMGDGTSVTCRTPGTVYQDAFGFTPSPDCGHRYTRTSAGQPEKAYTVSATSYWLVDWTGPDGSSGQIPLDLTSSTSIRVGELQALVTG